MLAQLSPRNGDCRRHVIGRPSLKVLQIFEDARVIAGIALLVFVANRQFRADDVSAPQAVPKTANDAIIPQLAALVRAFIEVVLFRRVS